MKFKIGKTKKLFTGKFITLFGTEFRDKGGKPQIWEWIRKHDVVAVLPITDDGKAVLIKNYRVPIQKYVIETPAGLADHKGETLEDLACRELLEETGYTCKKLQALPPYPFKAAESDRMTHGFVATGLKKTKGKIGDDTEDITVLKVPLKDIPGMCFDLPPDTFFSAEVFAMYEMARFLKIIP